MNKKMIMPYVLGATLFLGAGASLAQESEICIAKQTGERIISISGKLETPNADYAIQVFAPSKGAEDLSSESDKTNTDVLVLHEQGMTDENGEYFHEIEIDENGVGGVYNVVFNSEETGLLLSAETFNFTLLADFEEAAKLLNEYAKDEDLDGFLAFAKENAGSLAFYNEEFSAEDIDEAYGILYEDIKEKALDAKDIPEATRRFVLASLISEVNNDNFENAFYYKEFFEKDIPFISHINDNEEAQTQITSNLKESKSSEEFFAQIAEELLLNTVDKHDGVDNIRQVMEDVEKYCDVDPDDYSDDVLLDVSGKKYNSVSDFADALDKEKKKTKKPSTTGGGGGGSKSGSSTPSVVIPVEKVKENPEEISYDVYTDIDDVLWARNAIVTLTDMGILKGREALKFYPHENVKREEFVKMIVLSLAEDAKESQINFKDADKNAWYYTYVSKAVGAGLAKGYSDDVFGIGNNITREDLCVMAYNAVKKEDMLKEDIKLSFDDADEISDYAKEAVAYLANNGVINGVDGKNFAPKANATRAQAAKIIYMLLDM